jgi:UDP-N-acetylglucosamine 2-epimerase
MDMLAVAIAAFENVLAYERSQAAVVAGDTVIPVAAVAVGAADSNPPLLNETG